MDQRTLILISGRRAIHSIELRRTEDRFRNESKIISAGVRKENPNCLARLRLQSQREEQNRVANP